MLLQRLTNAAIQLCKREKPQVVAATGVVFEKLYTIFESKPIGKILISYRNGVWGEESFQGVGYPILRSTNMRRSKTDVTNPAWRVIPDEKAHKCILISGDILVTKSSGSSDLVGKATIFDKPHDGNSYLFSNFILRLRPNRSEVIPEYLAWFLRSPQALGWRFEAQQNAVGLRNLQTKEYLKQPIPLPKKEMQEQIVNFFDAVETGAIEKAELLPPLTEQERITAKIDRIAKNIEDGTEYRLKAIAELNALHSIVGRNVFTEKDKSAFRCLGEMVEIRGGGTPPKSVPFYWKEEVPWVTPKDMKKHEIGDSQIKISKEATVETSAKIHSANTVLVVVRGMILAHTVPSAILRTPAAVNQDMKVLYPKSPLTPEFLCAFFWATNNQLLELIEKSTHDTRKLKTEKLLSYKVPILQKAEQRRIVKYLDSLQTKVDKVRQLQDESQKELDALLPSILDKAFKGEL